MKRFLETLPLSVAEKRALDALDVGNAFEVISLSKASPEAFQQVVSPTPVQDLVKRILPYLSQDEVTALQQDTPQFMLGAKLGSAPALEISDRSQRDAMFQEYQSLDRIPSPPPEIVARKSELREQIEKMFMS